MAKCIYFKTNAFYNTGCTSTKHPSYSSKMGGATFGKETPENCNNGGKGCPVFKKELKG